MAHRSALDCDWCGAKDISREDCVRIGVMLAGAKMGTPIGVPLKIDGGSHPLTWIEVCESCAEKAEAAIRVWAREETACQVVACNPMKVV
jgi:prolyl-tRNA synthetase